jgi:hypothetical protein
MGLMMRKVETNACLVTTVGPATIGRSFPSNKSAKIAALRELGQAAGNRRGCRF